MLQGFLLLSGLPGGIGTRFQFFKSLVSRRLIQPVESFCKALRLSSGSAAGAEIKAAKNAAENPIAYRLFTSIAWSPLVGCTKQLRWLLLRTGFDDRIKDAYPLPVSLVLVDEATMQDRLLIAVMIFPGSEGDVQSHVEIAIVDRPSQ